jgi:hypothetical protein
MYWHSYQSDEPPYQRDERVRKSLTLYSEGAQHHTISLDAHGVFAHSVEKPSERRKQNNQRRNLAICICRTLV